MNFIGGRGGPLTVLLGLFIYAVIGCGYLLFWALVITCLIVKYMYIGIREGVRTIRRGREMHEPCDLPPDQPQPYISPVEYRRGDWS